MRSATAALLAAAAAASAQSTSISFFYPDEGISLDTYEDYALSVIDVVDEGATVVAFGCLTTTTASASRSRPTSSGSGFDDDDYYSYYNRYGNCVFADGQLTATVGPDLLTYTTTLSYADYSYDYDYTITVGCTSANEGAAFCTFESAGAEAYSDYCSYSRTDIDYDDDAAITSCVSEMAAGSTPLPASTSLLQGSEISTLAMTVTAGADKLSAGAAATRTGASATGTGTTSHVSKFTVTNLPTSGPTTTIGGPLASGTGASDASGSGSAALAQATGASGASRVKGAVGAVVGCVVVAALAL